MAEPCLAWYQNQCGTNLIRPTKTICAAGLCAVCWSKHGNRLILIDNGLGDKQNAEILFMHYYLLNGDDSLEKSFAKHGFTFDDVTDVFLTHLHFDHCGGSIKYTDAAKTKLVLTFKNAKYWSNQQTLGLGN